MRRPEQIGAEKDTIFNEVIWTDLFGGVFIAVGTKRSVFFSKDGKDWEVYLQPEEFEGISADANFTGVDVVELPLLTE